MIKQGMTILYVADQKASCDFYQAVMRVKPTLDVPGMTEFQLEGGLVLGLMPTSGIKRLLGSDVFSSSTNHDPKAELYIHVDDAQVYLDRAVINGATKVLEVEEQGWGDRVGYCLDPDHHVLAFAETP